MTSPAGLFAFLAFTAVSMVCHCKAEGLAPPPGLSHRWIDAFTVNVFWQKPSGLLAEDTEYFFRLEDPGSVGKLLKLPRITTWRNFTVDLLTEEKGSGSWTYLVWTLSKNSVNPDKNSNVSIETIETLQPRAQVKDIKCLVIPKNETYEMNCSWVPGNQALNFSFRVCGHTNESDMALKKCERPYGDAMRNGCYLDADDYTKDICMLFQSKAGLSTFKLIPMIDPPELSIREEGDKLKLSWTRPKIFKKRSLIFTVRYKKCSHAEESQEYSTTGESMPIPYDKSCRYEFRSSVKTSPSSTPIFSEFGQVVSYGTDKPADETLTVVAIVVPIILSVCILLSCYCFRRHSSILCPVIPDPSVIFKEMMMNGNKELKTTTGSLYTPVPEPVESCKVDSVTDSVVVPLNS